MGKKAGNRKHSKIDALDPALRETVEQMLLSGSTYSEIVDFLGANGVGISVASVCRYARAYQAEVQMLFQSTLPVGGATANVYSFMVLLCTNSTKQQHLCKSLPQNWCRGNQQCR